MSRRTGLAALAGVAAIALIIALIAQSRSDERATAIVTRGSIDVTIQTVGRIEAQDAAVVRSRVGGEVVALGAEPGDRVQAGDILVALDQEPFGRALDDAENQLEQAEFALQLAESRSSDNPDDAGRRLDTLLAADRVERAQRAVDDAKEQMRQSVLVAPRSGTLIELTPREGDVVGANQIVARVAAVADLRLLADVDELDLPNVQPGATARFRLDAFPAEEVIGSVTSTSPVARQQGGATVFSTTIEFTAPEGLDIRPGMNVEVTIVTDARQDVLLVPDGALRTVGSRSFVEVLEDGDIVEREVTLGYRGQGQVEVVAGLEEGDEVVLR